MLRLLILFGLLTFHSASLSQVSDFISVRKRNGRAIKTFMVGSPIVFESLYGSHVDGWISDIRNDSVFVKMYYTQTIVTLYGSRMLDTIGSYIVGIHHKAIGSIKVFKKRRSLLAKLDKLLIIGGAGYLLLNLANGAYLKEGVTDDKNLRSLGISLGAIGVGLLINHFNTMNNFSSKKHQIVYVRMTGK